MWVGSGHWSRVETHDIMHSGVPLCLALVGFLPLAMVEAGRMIGALGAGAPRVYLWWRGPCLVCLRDLVGTGVSWQVWRLDFLGLTDTHKILLNFLLLFRLYFCLYYTLYSFIFTYCNIAELSNKLNSIENIIPNKSHQSDYP